jgi:drug/metabolite transporter (DMT)-like permease
MLTNLPLVEGYSLYGLMTLLFIYALRDEELSFVYPIISLTYVWVTGLSVWFFHEAVNGFKAAGVAAIVAGVFVLGKDARK